MPVYGWLKYKFKFLEQVTLTNERLEDLDMVWRDIGEDPFFLFRTI